MGLIETVTRLVGGPPPERSLEDQARIESELSSMSLYHFSTCPFCIKVRRAMARLGLEMEMRDIKRDRNHLQELVAGGGKKTVPCLRIESEEAGDKSVTWMYESDDIIRFLKERYA